MKAIKITALVLCTAFLTVLLVANEPAAMVDNAQGTQNTNDSSVIQNPGDSFFAALNYDILGAMRSFEPDVVMVSSGDYTVTWGYFYFMLHDMVSRLTNEFSLPIDWDEPGPTGSKLGDIVIDYVVEQATQAVLFNYAIDIMGMTMSDEEYEYYQSAFDSMIIDAGGIENIEFELKFNGFYNFDIYKSAVMEFSLQEQLQYSLLDEKLADISDGDVAVFSEREGFMRAKHILVILPGEEEEMTQEELEEARVDALYRINAIYDELSAVYDNEDFADIFAEAVIEHSEDPGSFSSPDGYLFRAPDMVPQFSDATAALDPGQMSEVVETAYGYHIILRLPLDFDMVPVEFSNYGQFITLRQLAAYGKFEEQLEVWNNELNIVRSPQLETLDLSVLYRWQD